MWELVGAAVVLGLAGTDPAGFLLALAALAVGARGRAVVAFALVVVVGSAALGVTLSLTVGRGLRTVSWAALAPPDWVSASIELLVAVALLVWALVRHRRPEARPARPRRNRTGAALVGGGVLYALASLLDPTFVGLVVLAARHHSPVAVVAAHLVWSATSQLLLVVLAVAVALGRHQQVVAVSQRWLPRVRPVLAKAATATLVVAGAAVAADALWWFTTGRFLVFA